MCPTQTLSVYPDFLENHTKNNVKHNTSITILKPCGWKVLAILPKAPPQP